MPKCPVCSNDMPKKEMSKKLKLLQLSVSPKLGVYIKKIFHKIEERWAIKDIEKCAFYSHIENVNENIVINMINTFIIKKLDERGCTLSYLSSMIVNESKREEFKNEYERKRLDRIPPKLKD